MAFTKWIPKKEYQGWSGILHGGITATILDEVMEKLIEHQGICAVTAAMNIKYLKEIEIGKEVIARAWLEKETSKIFYLQAEIQNKDNEILAKGSGKYFRLKRDKLQI
jgi:uncharacterized protein (TIGR00369 family)